VAPKDAERVQTALTKAFPGYSKGCPQFWQHKHILLSPDFLEQNDIPYQTVIQRAGDVIYLMANSYHSGFSHGMNIGEKFLVT
jgi:hypothetical protein